MCVYVSVLVCVCLVLTILAGALSPQSLFRTPSSLPVCTCALAQSARVCACKLELSNSHGAHARSNAHDTCIHHSPHTHTQRNTLYIFHSPWPCSSLSFQLFPLFSLSLSLSSFAQLLAMNYGLYPYGVRKVSLGLSFPT